MCGRFTQLTNLAQWSARFFSESVANLPTSNAEAFNVAPTQQIFVFARNAVHRLACVSMAWGLVPGWSDSKSVGSKMINARVETVLEKPSFRKSIHTHRCVIPADGYYEWTTLEDGSKQPHYIRTINGEPFFFAAIWDQNKRLASADGQPLLSTSILTMAATHAMKDLHHRMPIMFFDELSTLNWLDERPIDETNLAEICEAQPDSVLTWHRVSKRVNRSTEQGPQLIESIEQ